MPKVIIPDESGGLRQRNFLKDNPDAGVARDSGDMGFYTPINSGPEFYSPKITAGKPIPIEGISPEYYQNKYAEDQGTFNKLMHGTGRAVTVLGFEVAKLAPAIVGGAIALGGNAIDLFQDGDQFDGMSWMNNKAVQWLDEKEQEAKENPFLAIYSNSDYDKMSWTEKLGTTDFWATQGADGIGFMASMFAPGMVLKALGMAGNIGKVGRFAAAAGESAELFGVAKKAKSIMSASKLLTEGEKLTEAATKLSTTTDVIEKSLNAYGKMKGLTDATANVLSKSLRWAKPAWKLEEGTNKIGKVVDAITIAGANGYFEAASESNETMNSLRTQLQDERSRGLNDLTDEQITEMSANAAATTFKYNMPLLLTSNLLLESVILNKFDNALGIGKRTAKEAEEAAVQVGKQFANQTAEKSLSKYMADNLKTYGMKDFAKETLFKTVLAAPKEGLFEEGLQNSIQRYAKKVDFLKQDTDVADEVGGILSQYKTSFSDLGDNEFWESVSLGAMLGMMGEVGVAQNAQMLLNGGLKNIDYNRRIMGGEAVEAPSRFMRMLGKEEKPKTEGIISTVEQLMRGMSDPKQFFKKDAKGNVEYDKETGRPTILPEFTNSFLANSIFKQAKIEELNKQIEALKGEKVNTEGAFSDIVNTQRNMEIRDLEADRESIEDAVMFDHFSKLFSLGMFSEDMGKSVIKDLVERQKANILAQNPTLDEHTVDDKLKDYSANLDSKMKEFENIYKQVEEASNYYVFHNPQDDTKKDYDEFVRKRINAMYAHLLWNRVKKKQVEAIDKNIEDLEKVKDGFQQMDDEMKRLYEEVDIETIADPTVKAALVQFRKEYGKIDSMEESFKESVMKDIEKEAREQFKAFGSTGIQGADKQDLTEDQYVELYKEHAEKNRKDFVDKNGKKTSMRTEFATRLSQKRSDFKFKILSMIYDHPELMQGMTKLSNINDLVKAMMQNDRQDYHVGAIERGIEQLNKNRNKLTYEMNTSKNFYFKAARPSKAKEDFDQYLKKLKEMESYEDQRNRNVNNLYKLLQNSNYVSGADVRNYAKLDNIPNRTPEQEKEYLSLKDKVVSANGKLKPIDYDILNNKLVTGEGTRRAIMLRVRDTHNTDNLTKEEKSELTKLKNKEDELTTAEELRYSELLYKLPETQILIRTEKWTDKDNKEQFITKVFVVNDTGLSSGLDNIKVNSKGEWKNMTVNSNSFFERFKGIQVLGHGSKEREQLVAKAAFYRRRNKRLQKIKAGEQILATTPQEIQRNLEIREKIQEIYDMLYDINITKDTGAIFEQLNQLLAELELSNNIVDKTALKASLKKLKGLMWKDKNKLTIEQIESLDDITDIDRAVLSYIQGRAIEANPLQVDIYLANELNDSMEEFLLKGAFNKKNKIYYLIKNLRNTIGKARKITSDDEGTVITTLKQEDLNAAKLEALEILKENMDNIDEDVKNLNEVIKILTDTSDHWRSEEYDVKALYEDMTNKFKSTSVELNNFDLSIGGIPQYISDIRARIDQIDRIKEKIVEKLAKIESDRSGEIYSDKRERLESLITQLKEVYATTNVPENYTEEEWAKEKSKEIKNAQAKIRYIEKQIKKIFEEETPVKNSLEDIENNLIDYFIINKFYKKLFYTYGNVKQSEYRRDDLFEESKTYPSTSSNVRSLFTISTNDVLYTEDYINGILRTTDKTEEIDYEGRKIVVPKLTEEAEQLAFQDFLSSYDILKHDLINFGVRYLLDSGKIIKDGNKYKLGTLSVKENEYKDVFEQVIDSMNKYVDKLDSTEAMYSDLIERLEFANYVIPFQKETGEFYEVEGTYAITAAMSPENRINKVAPEGLLQYIQSNPEIMNELMPVLSQFIKITIDGKGRYVSRSDFNAIMTSSSKDVVKKVVLKHYKAQANNLSAKPIQSMKIDSFGKGFRYRVREKDGAYFYRDFNKEDEVQSIFVIQKKEREDGGKKKRTSNSNSFYGDKYLGLPAVRHADGSEELIKVRNLEDSEAETVIALLFMRGLGVQTMGGHHLFPYQPDKKEWDKGLINSLIRYGTTQGLQKVEEKEEEKKDDENKTPEEQKIKKMHNKSNWSKKKRAAVEEGRAREYDVWVSKNHEIGKDQVNWIDGNGGKHSVSLTELVKLSNGQLVFDKEFMNFLRTKRLNISSDINRQNKKKVAIPYLNKEDLKQLIDGNTDSTPISAIIPESIKDFYLYGNDKTKAPVQTSSVPGRPKIVGRTVTVNPTTTDFAFKKAEKKVSGDKRDETMEEIPNVKNLSDLKDLPDGNYQIEIKGVLSNIEIMNGEIVEEVSKEAPQEIEDFIEENKDMPSQLDNTKLAKTLTKLPQDYKEDISKKKPAQASSKRLRFIKRATAGMLEAYIADGEFTEFFDNIDLSTDDLTDEQVRRLITDARDKIASKEDDKVLNAYKKVFEDSVQKRKDALDKVNDFKDKSHPDNKLIYSKGNSTEQQEARSRLKEAEDNYEKANKEWNKAKREYEDVSDKDDRRFAIAKEVILKLATIDLLKEDLSMEDQAKLKETGEEYFLAKNLYKAIDNLFMSLTNTQKYKGIKNFTLYGKKEEETTTPTIVPTKPNASKEILAILEENISLTDKLEKLEKYAEETDKYEDKDSINKIFDENKLPSDLSKEEDEFALFGNRDSIILYRYFRKEEDSAEVVIIPDEEITETVDPKEEFMKSLSKEERKSVEKILEDSINQDAEKLIASRSYGDLSNIMKNLSTKQSFIKIQDKFDVKTGDAVYIGLYLLELENKLSRLNSLVDTIEECL